MLGLVFMIFVALGLGVGYYGMIAITLETGDPLFATLLGIAIGFPLGLTYAEIDNRLTLRRHRKATMISP